MVFRLVGIIGLSLLPALAAAGEVGLHQAMGKWIRHGGAGGVTYEPVGGMQTHGDVPRWLLAPAGPAAVSARLLDRSTYPEATSLAWDREHGAVWVFGALAEGHGLRLVVDRDRQRPLSLRTATGVRWVFSHYRQRGEGGTPVPGRLTRTGLDGAETVLTPR